MREINIIIILIYRKLGSVGPVQQEIKLLLPKNDFTKLLDNLKFVITGTTDQLLTIKSSFKENLEDLVAESLCKIKDSITETLLEENLKLHQKIEKLESCISV